MTIIKLKRNTSNSSTMIIIILIKIKTDDSYNDFTIFVLLFFDLLPFSKNNLGETPFGWEKKLCRVEKKSGSCVTTTREIHPLDPQPHRHSMLVPRVCAPRVTRCCLGKHWSRDWFRGNFSLTQGLWNQQAANPGVNMLSMTHSGVRQWNLMTHAQCPLPVYYSQIPATTKGLWDMSHKPLLLLI